MYGLQHKRLPSVAAILLACAALAVPAFAGAEDASPDLSGTWTFFQEGLPRDYANLTKLRFDQEGSDLVATFTTGKKETVCRGYLDGDTVAFEYSRETKDGGTVHASYTGKVGGDMMRGEVDMGELGESTWQATRDDD